MRVLGGPNSPDESLVTHASDHGITSIVASFPGPPRFLSHSHALLGSCLIPRPSWVPVSFPGPPGFLSHSHALLGTCLLPDPVYLDGRGRPGPFYHVNDVVST